MSGNFRVFTLHVEGVNIDNISLEDISAYLHDFAELLGKDAHPRYHNITRGSLTVAARVALDKEIEVKTRGFLLRTGDAPEDAVRAKDRISRRLGVHRARKATIIDPENTKLIEIPIERPVEGVIKLPSLRKAGSVQGKVIRIGGTKELVSVEIQDVDGHIYLCQARRDTAKKLAKEMFDRTIRAHGSGVWERGEDALWRVHDFQIANFDILEEDSLSEVLGQVRQIRSAWQEDPSSFDKLGALRTVEKIG